MANTYITRTQTTGDRQKMTWSFWIKISGSGGRVFNAINASFNNNYVSSIHFNTTGYLTVYNVDGSSNIDVRPSRLYRDKNAWYHIVIAMDTTQSTASDRIKIYTNGVQETSFVNTTYPPQNADNTQWNYNGNNLTIGKRVYDTAQYTDGILSHFHFIDGTTYTPSAFGETDSTTGEWKIKVDPSVTYGNNGFFIFKNGTNLSGSTVQDQSGKGNNFTAYGNLIKSEDSPSNVFNVLNPLSAHGSSLNFRKGNTEIGFDASSVWHAVYSTIGATSGKYYAECLIDAVGGATSIGIIPIDTINNVQLTGDGDYMGKEANSIGYVNTGELYKTNSVQETTSTYTTADIISFTFDLDNNTIQFYKNNSSTGSAISLPSNTTYMIGSSGFNGSRQRWNFGNGYFGNSAVSSAGTNASGNGIFEYDVPTGFTALSTKGLNT